MTMFPPPPTGGIELLDFFFLNSFSIIIFKEKTQKQQCFDTK